LRNDIVELSSTDALSSTRKTLQEAQASLLNDKDERIFLRNYESSLQVVACIMDNTASIFSHRYNKDRIINREHDKVKACSRFEAARGKFQDSLLAEGNKTGAPSDNETRTK